MKISLNWIKDFVDLSGVTKEDIYEKLNLMCAEIENMEDRGADVKNVVFGKILEVKNHPESTKLHILKVDVGSEVLQIVCGAPNVRVGMITCVARVGGMVCGKKIGEAKLAGIESYGMCCAESELGIGADDDGIIDVDFDAKLGQDIKEVWPIDDLVIEIDNKTLTNRPDLWGHYGFAREFAAIFGRKLKALDGLDLSKFDGLSKVEIAVKTPECMRYSAMSVGNITVKKSPMDMKIRLNYCGMRDINLLADITNYIMLELGQPMHAFDNTIVKDILVTASKPGDKLLTLEGEEHEIPENATLICTKKGEPVAIAGIKGGLKASISETTSSVLFESATFSSANIRKTSRTIGLITDASLRYEKSLDPELTKIALARLLYVLHNVDDGIIVTSSFSDVYNYRYDTIKLTTTAEFISKRIGVNVKEDKILQILNSLGFICTKNGKVIEVVVPSFRATKDISIKEDLVEEVARMLNYGTFEAKPLALSVEPVVQDFENSMEFKAKKLLASKYGANEVHTYIWNYEQFNKEHKIDTTPILHLLDTRNAGQSGIRTMLVPTLLKLVEENKDTEGGRVKIFEIGRCVPALDENKLAIEEKHLAIAFASNVETEEELATAIKNYLADFAFNYVGATLTFKHSETPLNFMHIVNTADVYFNDKKLGYLGVVNPMTTKTIDKKLRIVCAEVDFRELCKCRNYPKKVKVPSQYQSSHLDLNFLVPKTELYGNVISALGKIRSRILVKYELIQIFESEALGENKSMLFRFEINGKDHNLTSAEIDGFMNDVIAIMQKAGYPLKN